MSYHDGYFTSWIEVKVIEPKFIIEPTVQLDVDANALMVPDAKIDKQLLMPDYNSSCNNYLTKATS